MNLDTALSIAVTEFANLKDKAGEPYILHLLRVMLAMDTEEEMIVAVLHDLLEDVPEWTPDRILREGFSARVVSAIICLTRDKSEDYSDYIVDRVSISPLATKVKLADLRDNLNRISNLYQIPNSGTRDWIIKTAAPRYIASIAYLNGKIDL